MAVLCLFGLATVYLIWQHPDLGTPIAVAVALLGLPITVIGIIIALARR
ncbi:hypothetical protein OG471_00535 [Streptomyces sp. NBC_01336]|nr:hypothetical protein OG471_00535 [Streptomyces sp. NBC_01336]